VATTAATATTLTIVVGYAAVAGLARPFTVPADLAAAVAGVTVLAMAAFTRPNRPARSRPAGVRWWALLAALVVALELAELFAGDRGHHPTLSSLAAPVLAAWLGRSIGYALWLLFGVALARR
jgi:putative Ca2+/H+ antiporter (TMEM165/GDT1 family)